MSVILTLICHASTRAVRDAAFPMDEPLDPQGLAKATELAAEIRRVDTAWTSPALRTRQTATALGLKAGIDPALRDIDYGTWSGRSLADIETATPEAIAAWAADCSAAPHGGESIIDLLQRIVPWFETVGRADGRVVAVTHAAVIRAAIVIALDAKPISFWRIDVAPLCRVRLRGNSGRWTLLSIGRSVL
jgi:broad specificity phosphatase PhoE